MSTFIKLVQVAALAALALGWVGCGSNKSLSLAEAGASGGTDGGVVVDAGADASTAGDAAGGAGGSGADAATDALVACDGGCGAGRMCCAGSCVNTANDPFNCGQCGVRCAGATPFCAGSCQAAPCARGACPSGQCCGSECCAAGQLCCQEQGPVSRLPICHTPTASEPTCPQGCAPLCRSDRAQKKNIRAVDPAEVLARLRRLPVSTWSYREEPDGVRHLGPMAQDFKQTFGLGDSERSYYAVDAHGVALAAIQALERAVSEQQRRIDALEARNRALERQLRRLGSRPR
jgi:endosialidase-like protein